MNRETTACIRDGHGFIPTADGPVFARRLHTAWWLAGDCAIDMRGDAGAGYRVVGAAPAGCALLYSPERLYRSREKAAKAPKRFCQAMVSCERPDIEGMRIDAYSAFYHVVMALFGTHTAKA